MEGTLGLFGGVRGEGEAGSSAEIAKLLNLPVFLKRRSFFINDNALLLS